VAGKTILVPGDFWNWSGEDKEENEAKIFCCLIHQFSGMHRFVGKPPAAAFQLEVVEDTTLVGTGEMVWMAYPAPFLHRMTDQIPTCTSCSREFTGASRKFYNHIAGIRYDRTAQIAP
jgi:hypothetical protein